MKKLSKIMLGVFLLSSIAMQGYGESPDKFFELADDPAYLNLLKKMDESWARTAPYSEPAFAIGRKITQAKKENRPAAEIAELEKLRRTYWDSAAVVEPKGEISRLHRQIDSLIWNYCDRTRAVVAKLRTTPYGQPNRIIEDFFDATWEEIGEKFAGDSEKIKKMHYVLFRTRHAFSRVPGPGLPPKHRVITAD